MRGEDRLLAWLRNRPGTELLGDDAAHLPAPPAGSWVATMDPQIGGVHVPADLDEILLARRLLHVNLSDVAASGARPAYALVSVSAPEGFGHRRFFDGLLEVCREEGVRLAGGDLSGSPTLVLTMTLLGHLADGGRPLSRGDGRAGDALWIGGTVGDSGAGQRLLARGARLAAHSEHAHVFLPPELRASEPLGAAARRAVVRHLAPRAQVDLGLWLASRPRAAAMDLSDGLARDLPRLAAASSVGAEVDAAALPLEAGFEELCAALEADPTELALGGGEDYVLLFALPDGEEPPESFGCTKVGRLVEGEELTLVRNGKHEPLPEIGWDHLDGKAQGKLTPSEE